jgi:glycosyltransferase involved in cell wall biosynthesis
MSKGKKIVGILAFGNEEGGGIYQYTQSIIDALKFDRTKKYVIFCNEKDDRFDNLNIDVRKLPNRNSFFFLKLLEYLQIILKIRNPISFSTNELKSFIDIDIFLCPSISLYPHFFLGKPFVFTLHDMQERYYPEFFTKKDRFFRWLNTKRLSSFANNIICESSFVKKDIIKFLGVSENKITIIESPPPEEFLNFSFEKLQMEKVVKKYSLPEKFIFYPAQCWPHKNHLNLIEAFNIIKSTHPDVNLVFIGSQKEYYKILTKKINDLNLTKKIFHLGYIDYEDLPYLYRLSEMLVMPSLFESVSIPVFEAFAIGTPVCCSNVVALPEQVGDAGVIFDPNNIFDMASKISLLLKDKQFKKELIVKGSQRVSNFNHQNYKVKLIGLFN